MGGMNVGGGGAGKSQVESELEEEIGNPSADGQTLYDILANTALTALTTNGDSLADRILENLAKDPGSTIPAQLTALNDLSTGQVQTQVENVLDPYGYALAPDFNIPVADAKPDALVENGSDGAVFTYEDDRCDVEATGGGNDQARIEYPRSRSLRSTRFMVMFYASWPVTIGNLTGDHVLGLGSESGTPGSGGASFRPGVGDNTAGNVTVNGVDGTIEYPLLTVPVVYTIEVDREAGETRFWAEKNPFVTDPDATIDAVPNRHRIPMLKLFQDGDSTNQTASLHRLKGYVIP